MKLPFLREEKKDLRTQVTFVGSRMEIYLPSYYLESGESMAAILGRRVECIGMFWFGASGKFYELQVPVKISFEFSERESARKRLQNGMPELDYDVFVLTNGDAFLYDTNHKESVDDIVFFIQKLVEGAKLPPTIQYDEIMSVYLKALEVTKINSKLGVNSVSIEFIMSELYRDKKNLSKPFRLSYNGRSVGPYDYKMLRIVKVPEQNSVFTGITGEDTDQQLISAVLRTREGKQERPSPIEEIIKY
jgi:hypothetical protein